MLKFVGCSVFLVKQYSCCHKLNIFGWLLLVNGQLLTCNSWPFKLWLKLVSNNMQRQLTVLVIDYNFKGNFLLAYMTKSM